MKEDTVKRLREMGMNVPASHCASCGRWATVVAGNNAPDFGLVWERTTCRTCGKWDKTFRWDFSRGWVVDKKEKVSF